MYIQVLLTAVFCRPMLAFGSAQSTPACLMCVCVKAVAVSACVSRLQSLPLFCNEIKSCLPVKLYSGVFSPNPTTDYSSVN